MFNNLIKNTDNKCILKEGQEYAQKGTYSLPFSKSTEVMFYNETYLRKFPNRILNNRPLL